MKRFWLVGLCFVFCFTCFCIAVSSVSAQEKTITLRFGNQWPGTNPNAIVSAEWCKEVEKRTNGRVKVRYYPGNVLNAAPAMYDSIVQGVIDIGNHVLGYTMGKFPLSEVLDYPLGYPSGYVATKLMNEYYNKFKPKEFDEVKVMYFHGQGPGLLHTKTRPVTKIEDLAGLKIRTFGPNARLMTLLGGTPVAMPMPDAYDALSRGVADGLMCAYEALKGWKLGEVVKYTTESYPVAYTATFVIAMNKAKWNSISPADQKIIEEINKEWIEKHGKEWDQVDRDGKEFATKRGNKIYKLSAEEGARWKAKAEPLFAEYVKNTKAKNLPGDEVLKFARDFIQKNSK